MGYGSAVSGQIDFTPGMSGNKAREYLERVKGTRADDWNGGMIEVSQVVTERDTPEGTLITVHVGGLDASEGSWKAYELERIVREFIEALPEDQSVSGYIQRIGEEWPDAERLIVKGRTVTSVKPKITWPES